MSRSFTCRRYDGQEVDRGSPRARDPCTNARRALQIITFGANTEEGESLILDTWLRERGVIPLWGERLIFAGRGGLRHTRQRIGDIEKRLADNIERLENVLADADAALAKPHVSRPAAKV